LRNYFYVAGAESSAGKTSLIAQLSQAVAERQGKKVLMISMDADIWEHAARDMSRNAGVSLPKAMRGFAGHKQIEEMRRCAEYLKKLPIEIDSDCFVLDQQEARMRMSQMRGQLGLIIVDYFQLTRMGDHNVDMNENYRIATCCKRYKQLAREMGCPVIGLSQVNRAFVTQNRFLMKQDLRGSGEIDEVAHGIWLLYKDRDIKNHNGKVEHKACREENHIRPVWIDVVKNKTGPLGMREFWMYSNYFKFIEAAEGAFERAAEQQDLGRLAHGPQEDGGGDDQGSMMQDELVM
jgi:replicative DNA helicase